MRKIVLRILAVLAIFTSAAAISAPTVNKQTIGTFEITGWQTLKMSETKMSTDGGRTYLRKTDGTIEAKAGSVVVLLNNRKSMKKFDAANAGDSVKSAELTGDVWLISRRKTGKSEQVTEARAAKAHIDWTTQVAKLEGNVSIISTDPEVFAQPSHVKGDRAIILLKKDLAPDEYRVIIESDSERSHIDVTPKSKK